MDNRSIMAEEFTHLVLTRFNTAVGYAPSARRLDTSWLEMRLEFFERYCLPSMAAQRCRAFEWIIFCDAASPEWFRERMDSLAPLARPMYIEGSLNDERIAASLSAPGLVNTPYLITTRLDNDDAIATDHLAAVQGAFRRQEREFLEFPVGMQSFRGHLYTLFWPSNPFLSLFEKVGSSNRFTTVCCVRHDHVRSAGHVRRLICSPQWLQVIHGSNIGNSLRGWPRFQSRTHPNFAVHWPTSETDDPLPQRMKYAAVAYRDRALRWLSRHAPSAKTAA